MSAVDQRGAYTRKMPAYYSNVREDVLRLLPDTRFERVLEIGGGDFPTLLTVGDRTGAELWGVDLRPVNLPGVTFVQGSFDEPAVRAQLPKAGFDLIIANDVIEHLLDSEGFFATVFDRLRPGGLLALSVPNIRQIRALYCIFVTGSFPRTDAGLFDRTHIRWFCRKDVLRIATATGLKLQRWEGSGRLVPKVMRSTGPAEFLALQNLFLLQRP